MGSFVGLGMFPTRVGMNLVPHTEGIAYSYVPHTCGDEPAGSKGAGLISECSPHVWG